MVDPLHGLEPGRGWHPLEEDAHGHFRWMGREAAAGLPSAPGRSLLLEVATPMPGGQTLTVSIDGRVVLTADLRAGSQLLTVPAAVFDGADVVGLRLQCAPLLGPEQKGTDRRELGVAVRRLGFEGLEADVDAALPAPLVEAVHEHVRATHAALAQAPPGAGELAQALARARQLAGNRDRLQRLAAAGRLREVTDLRPLHLEMDLLDKCNLRCVMCMMGHPTLRQSPLHKLSVERFEQLADELFWHVRALSFTYGTEPLLHPEFRRFVAIAGRYRIPRVYCVTNGQLLDEDIARTAVTHGMHAIVVSMDAARASTYERIRVGGNWERLLANVRMLQRVKRELGSETPHLEVAFVMMRANIAELPAFVRLAGELGATTATALHMLPYEQLGLAAEACSNVKETTNGMLRAAQQAATEVGVRFLAPPRFGAEAGHNLAAEARRRFGLPVTDDALQAGHCPFPRHFLAIDMNGNVVPCGWWQGGGSMGNIHRQSFAGIWHGEAYAQLREEHRQGRLGPVCRRCPAAGIGAVDQPAAFVPR